MQELKNALKSAPVVYVTREMERAVGLAPGTENYYIITNHSAFAKSTAKNSLTVLLIKEKQKIDTRKLLEHNLFNHSLITPDVLEKRHRMSVGKNLQAFLERSKAAQGGGGREGAPLWQRLDRIPVPTIFIYGKQDRGSAAERAALAKERFPNLNLHLIDRCRHLVQWDAASEFERLTAAFLAD